MVDSLCSPYIYSTLDTISYSNLICAHLLIHPRLFFWFRTLYLLFEFRDMHPVTVCTTKTQSERLVFEERPVVGASEKRCPHRELRLKSSLCLDHDRVCCSARPCESWGTKCGVDVVRAGWFKLRCVCVEDTPCAH